MGAPNATKHGISAGDIPTGDRGMSDRRLAVVSYLANDPLTPRGTRTKALINALERDWAIELHSSSALHAAPHRRAAVRRARKVVARVSKRLILDPQEPWSYHRFRSWKPQVDAALLIGWPMSPLVYAAARLRGAGIPYLIDVGDPWVLTNPGSTLGRPVISRAARAERVLWSGASGAVVTTKSQADAFRSLYPDLPILIRPSGYQGLSIAAANRAPRKRAQRAEQILKLLNFGTLYMSLVDVSEVLAGLVDSGLWREVKFTHFGHAWPGALERASLKATVSTHPPVPWEEAVALARDHDVAVVLGTRPTFRMRVPSKAAQYLTLPIPRLAISSGADGDELGHYVNGKPGWLCCSIDDPRLPERLRSHVSREWSEAELAPPVGESWPRVADEVAAFVDSVLSRDADTPSRSRRGLRVVGGPRRRRASAVSARS
jgi:hypothetical protein